MVKSHSTRPYSPRSSAVPIFKPSMAPGLLRDRDKAAKLKALQKQIRKSKKVIKMKPVIGFIDLTEEEIPVDPLPPRPILSIPAWQDTKQYTHIKVISIILIKGPSRRSKWRDLELDMSHLSLLNESFPRPIHELIPIARRPPASTIAIQGNAPERPPLPLQERHERPWTYARVVDYISDHREGEWRPEVYRFLRANGFLPGRRVKLFRSDGSHFRIRMPKYETT